MLTFSHKFYDVHFDAYLGSHLSVPKYKIKIKTYIILDQNTIFQTYYNLSFSQDIHFPGVASLIIIVNLKVLLP